MAGLGVQVSYIKERGSPARVSTCICHACHVRMTFGSSTNDAHNLCFQVPPTYPITVPLMGGSCDPENPGSTEPD